MQRLLDELMRDDSDLDEYRRSVERSRQGYEASRRRLNDMVALATGRISTTDYLQKHGQAPAAPAVAADWQGATPVREISSLSPVSLPTPSPSPAPTPTPVSPDAAISTYERQLILDNRSRYRVARNVKDNPVSRPVARRRQSEAEKNTVIDQFLENRGALAFTLKLSRDVEAQLLGNVKKGKKLVQMIADRISREFREKHGVEVPPFTFRVEALTREGYWMHLHGVILACDLDRGLVWDCLKNCLGNIPGQSGSTQLKLQDFYNARSRWRRYSQKNPELDAAYLGTDQLTYIREDLKRLAGEWHEERRRREKPSRKSVAADPVENPPTDREQPVAVLEELPADDSPAVTHRSPLTSTSTEPLESSRPAPEARQRVPVDGCAPTPPLLVRASGCACWHSGLRIGTKRLAWGWEFWRGGTSHRLQRRPRPPPSRSRYGPLLLRHHRR